MSLTSSEQKIFDAMFERFEDSKEGWENYLEVYDNNFEEMSKKVNDGIGGILANAAIAIAEQKKLLQGAKTPSALTAAIKLIAVTGGNLLNAGTSMLSWASKQLPRRDSVEQEVIADKGGIEFLSWLSKKLPKRDSVLLSDCDLVMTYRDGERCYAMLHRKKTDDYALACDFTDACDEVSVVGGFKDSASAFRELGEMLKR